MRISPATILWLAAASSVGVVRGEDSITFNNSDFTTGQDGAAVFVGVGLQQTHRFHWSVTQSVEISIKDVNLRADDQTLVGTFSSNTTATTGSGSAHSTTLATTTTGDGLIPATPSPLATHAQNMRGHDILPIIPVLRGEKRDEIGGSSIVPALPGIITSEYPLP
jgi:hypothetical protein